MSVQTENRVTRGEFLNWLRAQVNIPHVYEVVFDTAGVCGDGDSPAVMFVRSWQIDAEGRRFIDRDERGDIVRDAEGNAMAARTEQQVFVKSLPGYG